MTEFSGFKKTKNNKFYFIYLTFLFSFIILISCYCYINNMYKDTIKNRLQNRVLNITSYDYKTNTKKVISDIPHVVSVYPGYTNVVMYSKSNIKYIFNYYKYNIKCVDKKIIKKLNKNEVIIPNSLNIKKGKKLIAYLNEEKYEFEIVGIYDDKKIGSNDIFASESFMKNNSFKSNENNWNAIIDEYDNINTVIKQLNKKKYDATIKDEAGLNDIKFYDICLKIFTIGEFILLMAITYILSLIIKDTIDNNKYDIAILKTCGFHDFNILKIITNNLIIISLKTISIIYAIILISYYLLCKFNKISYDFLSLIYIVKIISLCSIIFFIIILLTSIHNFKNIKKISPIDLFKTN